jgi:TRAP-type C4-dicarboxylate transport system substrate-binding protein
MTLTTKIKTLGLVGATASLMIAGSASAQVKLTMTYPFPDFLTYTKLCKQLAADINAAAKGKFQINQLPFNSIKMFQQPPALRAGRIDMMCIPAAFYARALPENEAVSTSNSTPAKVRANGGIALLDQVHQKYYNAKYLGWTTAGNRFRIYLKNPPKFNKKGLPDFTGVKLRDNPIYGAFFKALGASTHPMPSTAAYAALEKGVIDAAAWATTGLIGLKWNKFLNYGLEPEFYSTDIGWVINLKKWDALDVGSQDILQYEVIKAESKHRKILEDLATKERAALIKGGMKFIQVPNAKLYSKLAVDSAYARMTARLKKTKRGPENAKKLRALWIQ